MFFRLTTRSEQRVRGPTTAVTGRALSLAPVRVWDGSVGDRAASHGSFFDSFLLPKDGAEKWCLLLCFSSLELSRWLFDVLPQSLSGAPAG